jgi:hypothetical protein
MLHLYAKAYFRIHGRVHAGARYHRVRFMQAARQAPLHPDMRVCLADLRADLHDVRGRMAEMPLVHHATADAAGQELARRLRESGSGGIVHSGVRRTGGECAAVFRPKLLSNCRQERHLTLRPGRRDNPRRARLERQKSACREIHAMRGMPLIT